MIPNLKEIYCLIDNLTSLIDQKVPVPKACRKKVRGLKNKKIIDSIPLSLYSVGYCFKFQIGKGFFKLRKQYEWVVLWIQIVPDY